jgi:hypothetical protein
MLLRRLFSFIPFFNGNECGSSNYGSDVYISNSAALSGNPPFLSSYSTTPQEGKKRCYYGEIINSQWKYQNKSEWLTDAPSSFHQMMNEEHEEREDSYGCGIDECFPCSSSVGIEKSKLNGVNVIPMFQSFPYHSLQYCYSLSFFYSSSICLHSSASVEYGVLCGHHSTPCSSMEEGKEHFDSTIQKKFIFLSSFFSFFFLFNNTTRREVEMLVWGEY